MRAGPSTAPVFPLRVEPSIVTRLAWRATLVHDPAMDVYLNGRIVPASEAKVAWDDAGLQHAVGLFETMSARGGAVFRLRQHVERLSESARVLGLAREVRVEPLMQAVQAMVDHAARGGLEAARVRLTVTAGTLNLLRGEEGVIEPRPTVMVVVTPPTVYDPAYFERGVRVTVAGPLANPLDPLAGHKTLNYWGRLRTLRQAASAPGGGAGESIWLQVTNHLASGVVSNLFVVRDGRLLTPIARGEEVTGALPAPVLPGVTRAAVMELAAGMGVGEGGVERRMLTITDLLDADEVFLTNSSWGVLPVRQVEGKPIGGGGVGELTAALRRGLEELVVSEAEASQAVGREGVGK